MPPEVVQEAGRSLETLFLHSVDFADERFLLCRHGTDNCSPDARPVAARGAGATAPQPRAPVSSNIPNLSVTASDLVSRELQLASPDVYYRIMEVINSTRSSFP